MSHLTVKDLRHYHDVGLLVPAEVDPVSGHRFYRADQVQTAQVIRRFRDLGMSLDGIESVLRAPDAATRSGLIVEYLGRMESQPAQPESVVSTLRALLDRPPAGIPVEHRSVGAVRALAISDQVCAADRRVWWNEAFAELDAALAAAGVPAAGPRAALYSAEYFAREAGGEVVAYVPVTDEVSWGGRAKTLDIPPADLAVAVHEGSSEGLDRTYGALGMYVTERDIGVEGAIREYYLVSPFDTDDESRHRTEVCWPVFRTRLTVL
jgi:DNA-binding transcriptional MerR regulator/effector-binding domain-containing protein